MITKINIGRAYIFSPSIHVMFRAEITGRPQISSIKEAITYAVRKYEILNCRILQDDNGDFFYVPKEYPSKPNIEVRNYHQDSQEFVNEQERIRLNLEAGELSRYIIADDGNKIVLNIVQNHLAGDGKSILIFLEDVMNYIQKIEEGEKIDMDSYNIVPVNAYNLKYISQFAKLNPLLEMTIADMNKKWNESNDRVFTHKDAVELFEDYWKVNKTKIATATIEADTMKKFASICKKNGVTVNNAMLASMSRSINRKSKICVAVDMRTKSQVGMGNYAGFTLIESLYDDTLSFWVNARNIQELIKSLTADRSQLHLSSLITTSFEPSLRDATYFQMMNKFHSNVIDEYNSIFSVTCEEVPLIISNLGLEPMKRVYGEFEIEELSFFSPVSIGFDSNMGVITENGKMVINLQYNENNIDYRTIFDELVNSINYVCETESEYHELLQYV